MAEIFDLCIADKIYRCHDTATVTAGDGSAIHPDVLNSLLFAVCTVEGDGPRRCVHGAGASIAKSKTLDGVFDVTFPNGFRITARAAPVNVCALQYEETKALKNEIERLKNLLQAAEINDYRRFCPVEVSIEWSKPDFIRRLMISKVLKTLVQDPNIQDRCHMNESHHYGYVVIQKYTLDTSYSADEFEKAMTEAVNVVFQTTKTLLIPDYSRCTNHTQDPQIILYECNFEPFKFSCTHPGEIPTSPWTGFLKMNERTLPETENLKHENK